MRSLVTALVTSRGWGDQVRCAWPAEDVVLRTDPRRVERILGNLGSNAVEHGGRDVSIVVEPRGATVTVRVADRGPGIAPEHLPHLFDRFYKAAPARAGGGRGIGLAISRENARLLGGGLRGG